MRKVIALMLFLSAVFSLSIPFGGKIAVVKIDGTIGSDVTARDVVEALENVRTNPLYVAVILDINSGGGSAVQSHEIVRELDRINKPKIAYIEDIGASGAYWIASACDYIVADELSIVGSIGALSSFYSPEGLAKKLGIAVYEISYPANKSFGSVFFNRTFLPYAREMVKSAGSFFIEDVVRRRPSASAYVTGLPYLAKDARGLVDAYGGMHEAINMAKKMANAKYAEVEHIEVKRGLRSLLDELGMDSLMRNFLKFRFIHFN